eukprot:TRINITY_DN76286_c0_g1_i1.p1 TRINITY_DN76286_c0_g1~~TRINITY_DN76286_c0_g1_i1.p1  ORF type:complete len:530 (-),score=39.02 TRINITY_DN76286_c0_g1_i1:82-1671(-)
MRRVALFFALISVVYGIVDAKEHVSVYYDGLRVFTKPIHDPMAAAWGIISNDISKTGWSTLEIFTNSSVEDSKQAYAGGFAEGSLGRQLAYDLWYNEIEPLKGSIPSLKPWIEKSIKYIEDSVAANQHDDYWMQVGLAWQHFLGFVDGYNADKPPKPLSKFDWYLLQAETELGDILIALGERRLPNFATLDQIQWNRYLLNSMHCSGFIKLTDDLSSLYFGHTTWSDYTTMLRQVKIYHFNYNHASTAAKTVMFSGYPGQLVSTDDYYQMSSGLAVMETTFNIFDDKLYKACEPTSVPYWLRIQVANHMARDAPEWVSLYGKHNSGTYNNQWMVVDYNKFTPGQPLKPNTFWILEQLPGIVEVGDMTQTLAFGYWPSYNVPYFPKVYQAANYTSAAKIQPHAFSFQLCARATIFRRNETDVSNIEDFKNMMRYNNYKHDPLSFDTPSNAIAARFDLARHGPMCGGSIDSKVTNNVLMKDMKMQAISGPSNYHNTIPVFDFSTTKAECGARLGVPEKWDFNWVAFVGSNK